MTLICYNISNVLLLCCCQKQIIWKTDKSLANCTIKKKLNTSFQKPLKLRKHKEFLINVKPPPKNQFS